MKTSNPFAHRCGHGKLFVQYRRKNKRGQVQLNQWLIEPDPFIKKLPGKGVFTDPEFSALRPLCLSMRHCIECKVLLHANDTGRVTMRIRNFFVLFVFLFGSVSAEINMPQTPAAQRAGEVLIQLNLADMEQAGKFIEQSYAPDFRDAFPIAMHLGIFTTTSSMFGELEVFKVINSGETSVSLLLRSVSRDAFIKLEISVEPENPHRITVMGLAPVPRPEGSPVRTDPVGAGENKAITVLDPQTINWADADKLLTTKADNNEFSGAVLIARDGKPLFSHAYGYASRKFGVKNSLETRFNLGSLNKLFTAVAISQLVEQGKVALDGQIGQYLEGFPPEISGKVTVRQLLQMRAGWGDYWDNEYYLAHRSELRDVSDYMEFIRAMPLDFEPGANFQHCNTCFEVLGAIVEYASGMDYYEYIDENIYAPAGMADSGSFHRDGPAGNLATGYTDMNPHDPEGRDYHWSNEFILPVRGTPAGGGYSTTGDLLKFDQAFRQFELLDQDHTEFVMSRFEGHPGDEFTARGISKSIGGAAGVGALYARDLESGITILILSNFDFPATIEAFREISELTGIE